MNKQKLIRKYEDACFAVVPVDEVLEDLQQLDEPQAGHAEEAPRYLKNILARLRELPLHNREVWLKAIMSEFERDFSHAKWREGYKQGKFEAMFGCEKIVVPQFVADWYEIHKDSFEPDLFACIRDILNDGCVANISEFEHWILGRKDSITTLVNMHQFGYEVEREKRYLVGIKGVSDNSFRLKYHPDTKRWIMGSNVNNSGLIAYHTRKELEEAGFGWVFSCEGIEIEEVENDI